MVSEEGKNTSEKEKKYFSRLYFVSHAGMTVFGDT